VCWRALLQTVPITVAWKNSAASRRNATSGKAAAPVAKRRGWKAIFPAVCGSARCVVCCACLPPHPLTRPCADGKDADCQKKCCKKRCSEFSGLTCPTGWQNRPSDDHSTATDHSKVSQCCTKACDSFSGSCLADQKKETKFRTCISLGLKTDSGSDYTAKGDPTAKCTAKTCCLYTCASAYVSHYHAHSISP
jgi:hypothetical protein